MGVLRYNSNYTGAEVDALLASISGKQDVITDLQSIRSGASAGASAVQPGALAAVATSGSYNDLGNKPTIPGTLAALSGDSTHRVVTDAQVSGWNAKLGDAPSDGKQYAREDGAWVEVDSGVGSFVPMPVQSFTVSQGTTTLNVDCNKMYVCSSALPAGSSYRRTAWTIKLNGPVTGMVSEYCVRFTTPSSVSYITIAVTPYSGTLTWVSEFAVEASKTYEINIVDNLVTLIKV